MGWSIRYILATMKKLVVLLVAILLIAGVGAALYWSTSSGRIMSVHTARLELAHLLSSVATNGKVEPDKISEIRAPVSGICTRIASEEGERLRAGQTILRIDNPTLKSEVAAAQAELNSALVELRNIRRGPSSEERSQVDSEIARIQLEISEAQKIVSTNEWLLSRNAISRFDVEQSRRQLVLLRQALESANSRKAELTKRFDSDDIQRAESRVQAARSRVIVLEDNLARTALRTPFDGTLYQFTIKEGAYVNTGDLIGLFADLSKLRVRAFVDEPDLGRLAEGQEVVIRWDAHPVETWKGQVRIVPPEVVAHGTRSVAEVLCTIESPLGNLIPNINVDVEIMSDHGPTVPSLPRNAVFPDGKDQFVWLIRHGRAEKRIVETGRSTVRLVELTRGLSIGDQVIIPGEAPITEGMRVRVAEE